MKPRIGFLLPHYSRHSQSYMPVVMRVLADAGAVVDLIHPVDGTVDLSKLRVIFSGAAPLGVHWPLRRTAALRC